MTNPEAQAKRPGRSFAVHVDAKVCDGCGICIFFCKPAVFELCREISVRGVFPAQVVRAGCNGCGLCELGCPQLAIFVASRPAAEQP